MSEFDDIDLDDIDLDFNDIELEESEEIEEENEEVENLTLDVDDLDLDDEIIEDLPKPAPKVEKSAQKVEKAKPVEPTTQQETGVTIRFEPDFDISPQNLDTKTFQIRKTKRTPNDVSDLKDRIAAQGQVEPIQIVIKDGKNYLIAGEGRVLALRQLERKAKAIVYTGLTDDEITKISFGTNEGRLAMSEWDKIASIGQHFDKDPEVSKDDPDDPNSLVNVFGLNRSSIYNYLKLWQFFQDKEDFHAHFNKYRCPLYVITGTVEIIKDYENDFESWLPIVEILQVLNNRNDISRKTFTHIFLKEITDLLLQVRMAKNPLNFEDETLDDPVLSRMERQTKREIKDKIQLDESEKIKRNIEKHATNRIKADQATKYIKDVDTNLENVIKLLGELGEIENFHELIHSTVLKATMKRVNKVNQLINILV